ncbi:hypothetical protein QAD02_008876 [Eretmocerus hayati]|uniref:Uncharacterized protein n=1 Tax=Eretmocerus hayati TaxID=131215 RepID=A0ACC2N834_9HYME|nr:hypothetical protein QAD02_008876 [Eretmocerus hayati]
MLWAVFAIFVLISTSHGAIVSGRKLSSYRLNSRFSPNGRIVGGRPAPIEEFPWQVSLERRGNHFCGGSIISSTYILTAGHCVGGVSSVSSSGLTARVGSDKRGKGTSYNVTEIIRHTNFSANRHGIPTHDIALLKLASPIDISKNTSQPIELYDEGQEANPGEMASISGWGTRGPEHPGTPEQLHAVEVPVVARANCSEAYKRLGGLPEGQICAAYPEGGKDSCQGDSGGPMVIGKRQAGIVSWGNGCAKEGYPGVYTEIAAYRSWIRKHAGL